MGILALASPAFAAPAGVDDPAEPYIHTLLTVDAWTIDGEIYFRPIEEDEQVVCDPVERKWIAARADAMLAAHSRDVIAGAVQRGSSSAKPVKVAFDAKCFETGQVFLGGYDAAHATVIIPFEGSLVNGGWYPTPK